MIYKGVETFLLQTRFKALRGSPKGKTQIGQCLLAVDLGRYKWYQSRHRTMCQPFRCSPKGVDTMPDTGRCVSLFSERG